MSKLMRGKHAEDGQAVSAGSPPRDRLLIEEDDSTASPALARLAGATIAGLIAGGAMYLTLAAFALNQGRGFGYPLHAVQGMMSGRRVIPDHPANNFVADPMSDYLVAPLSFFAPAIFVALAVTLWQTRRKAQDEDSRVLRPAAVLVPIAVLTTVLFFVLVLGIGYLEGDASQQRISSGYGVRELGIPAWVTAHLAYVLVLTALLGLTGRAFGYARSRR